MSTLLESLGTLPSGQIVRLSPDDLTKFLREKYLDSDAEKLRQRQSRNRLDLYHDRGRALVEDMISAIFKNATVRQLRKEFVKYAMFQNLSKRIIREISMVYSETAIRSVSNANENYQAMIRSTRMDRKMRSVNRYTNLLNECLVWFDIRGTEPVLRVVTPDRFWAIHHPLDPTHFLGAIISIESATVQQTPGSPKYLVISDTEFFKMDKDGRLISGTYQEHGIGRLPCLLVHREEPEEKLLDSSSGEDLISAHLAVALLNTLMLKHQKSGTNLIAATGDISTTANDQPMDEECITNFGEGVSLQNLDLGANPSNYISAARSVLTQVAANYGISESVFSLQYSATSGFEIELKRSALREVRNDQILDYRPVERELVEIQSRVLSMAGHEMKFDSSGFQVNFGETQAPRDPKAMLEYFEQARRMGLLSTQQMYMKMNPEASAQDAEDAIAVNAMVEARRVSLYRELNISPMASAEDPGLDPQQNGQLRIISSD